MIDGGRDGLTNEIEILAFRTDHEGFGDGAQPIQAQGTDVFRKARDIIFRLRRKKSLALKRNSARKFLSGQFEVVDRDIALDNFDMFLEVIRRAHSVHTDRLHVMICSALLGKTVYAYPTAYGKLEAVYMHSMKDWAECTFVPIDGVKRR